MYEKLKQPPVDAILQLAIEFREDKRPDKMDLGIGVYKDARGKTPVMAAVKKAETLVHEREDTKAYISLAGDEAFNGAMLKLLFGSELDVGRTRAIQTVGGGAAIRLLADTIKAASPGATIWVSDPTWINHVPIMAAVGLRCRSYRYLDRASNLVDFAGMRADLERVEAGDVVLLHGCCHNPSGADLDEEQWRQIASDANRLGFVPFVDVAYQGFGEGLEADACSIRLLVREVPEFMVAASCSKNFGLYRDRVGCAVVVGKTSADADVARATLLSAGRVTYSFPANHGAATVATILADSILREDWQNELDGMRDRMRLNRRRLAETLRRQLNDDHFDYIEQHHGMFSMLDLTPDQVLQLRREHAVFMPLDGRMNVAGLQEGSIERLALAVASAG